MQAIKTISKKFNHKNDYKTLMQFFNIIRSRSNDNPKSEDPENSIIHINFD